MFPRTVFQALCLLCFAHSLFALAQNGNPLPPYRFHQKTRTVHTAAEFRQMTKGRVTLQRSPRCQTYQLGTLIGTSNGVVQQLRPGVVRPFPNRPLPYHEITVIAEESPTVLWFGTKRGAIRFDEHTDTVQYFAGMRWLPADEITGIGFEKRAPGNTPDCIVVWLETPKGFSRIEHKPMTLAEKANAFSDRVQKRHVRWGQTSDSHLRVPGDLSSNQMVSSDNDGLWTAMYVAAEAFRFKVTGEAAARVNAKQGMQALLRLEEITGIPGFPARSFIKKGVDLQPGDGEWHDTPDGIWRWKGDTSSDEIVGHYFVFPIYFDLVADEAEKKQLAATLDRITNHILDNNYELRDVDGKHTRWGWWGPDVIWEDPDETGLRALHLLAHLRTAMHVTQDTSLRAKYQRHYDELITKHRYHLLLRNQKINVPGHVNHSDDELAFLSYYPLLQYETDPKLREVYVTSLERAWQIERPERNPLWNFIYAVGSGSKEFDREESVRTLREIPWELIEWTVTNSHRLDVPRDLLADRFGRKQALVVLPYDELPMTKWNGNPYRLDGGNGGRSEDDGAYFLLPYWLGRYHKLIDE